MCRPKIENRIGYGWDSHSYCWISGVLCFFLRKPIHSYRILSTCSVLPNIHQSSAPLQSTCFLAVVSICLLYHIHGYARHVPISRNAKKPCGRHAPQVPAAASICSSSFCRSSWDLRLSEGWGSPMVPMGQPKKALFKHS